MIEYPRDLIFEVMFYDDMKPDSNKIRLNEDEEEEDWKKGGKKKKSDAITIDSCF